MIWLALFMSLAGLAVAAVATTANVSRAIRTSIYDPRRVPLAENDDGAWTDTVTMDASTPTVPATAAGTLFPIAPPPGGATETLN